MINPPVTWEEAVLNELTRLRTENKRYQEVLELIAGQEVANSNLVERQIARAALNTEGEE